ncbi:MAG TPA: hypothetical protein VF286_10505 [Acidiphilium sp.]
MTDKFMDVWDIRSFDNDLVRLLTKNGKTIQKYFETAHRQLFEREASDHRGVPQSNPYEPAYYGLLETLEPMMAARVIRAWHYTRLTDTEVAYLVQNGPALSDIEGIRRRLDRLVTEKILVHEDADRLFSDSIFRHSAQHEIRSGRFWATAHPISIEDGDVMPLLEHWGGESIYFCQENPRLLDLLRVVGLPRVVELSLPLAATDRAWHAGEAVISTFAQSVGCNTRLGAFDVCARRHLGSASILAIHSAEGAVFGSIGHDYPPTLAGIGKITWAE